MELLTILDQIQALSNERQALWRIAHRDKFSSAWWKRHDRIETIGKQLNSLWHIHRIELANAGEHKSTAIDRVSSQYFDDFRERVGWYQVTEWRIEDETSDSRRYMSVGDGLYDNQRRQSKPIKKHSNRPNVGARQRQRATQGMIQLN